MPSIHAPSANKNAPLLLLLWLEMRGYHFFDAEPICIRIDDMTAKKCFEIITDGE